MFNNDNEYFESVLKSLIVERGDELTYLVVLAHHMDNSNNLLHRISCKKGVPIKGYVYDSHNDAYHVECCDYMHLGYIPVSLFLRQGSWKIRVPVPEDIVLMNLNESQKLDLENFKLSFKNTLFKLEFLQVIDPN